MSKLYYNETERTQRSLIGRFRQLSKSVSAAWRDTKKKTQHNGKMLFGLLDLVAAMAEVYAENMAIYCGFVPPITQYSVSLARITMQKIIIWS